MSYPVDGIRYDRAVLQGVASPERESRIVEEVQALKAEHQAAQQKVLEMQDELER